MAASVVRARDRILQVPPSSWYTMAVPTKEVIEQSLPADYQPSYLLPFEGSHELCNFWVDAISRAVVFQIDAVTERYNADEKLTSDDLTESLPPYPLTIFDTNAPPQWKDAPDWRRWIVVAALSANSDPPGLPPLLTASAFAIHARYGVVQIGIMSTEAKSSFAFSDIQLQAAQIGQGEQAPYIGEQNMEAFYYPMFFALTLLGCRNIHHREVSAYSDRFRRHLLRRSSKVSTPPLDKYRVLTIRVPGLRNERPSNGSPDDSQVIRAAHLHRGHFKQYEAKPLFGRYRGRYWWAPHMRGSRDHGTIIKDYKLVTES